MEAECRIVAARVWGGQGLAAKGHKGNLGGDGSVLKLDVAMAAGLYVSVTIIGGVL